MQIKHQRLVALLATSALAVGGLSACGSDDDDSSSSSTTTAAATTAAAAPTIDVPADIKSKGKLVVAADASYAPNEFIGDDGKTVEGADVDLANAIGKTLGLTVEVKNAGFDSIIPGLAAKKYDLGMSSFTDTKEREATVDFVTYFSAGTSFYTKASGGADVTGLDDLCGKTVAVEKGTTQADDSTAQSKKCTEAGKEAVKVSTFPDQNGANLAISSGRAQIGMADSPVAAYQVKQANGQFKLVGTPYGTAPYGIAIPKDSGLAEPVLAAVKQMISDGSYKEILGKWGIEDGAITDPVINGAES
ncbi:ABC transporter substrate-binding protein [Baekduia sp. Peel2402]|uniref:ABC transporter substrate-binding protein n=1 Tax=Baekduia sp. Peel2402 TaxID=3458296 RepID=UPI00403EC4EB